MARVTNIYLRPSSRTPVQEVASAEAVVGSGLRGDHTRGGSRQISLIEKQNWEAACSEVGRDDLAPGRRRANVVIEGLSLEDAIGQSIQIGECVIDIIAELRPCKLMDDVTPGLMNALSPQCRGGAYGRVIKAGLIEVGAPVALIAHPSSVAS